MEGQLSDATAVIKTGRSTLYSTIIDNNERWKNIAESALSSSINDYNHPATGRSTIPKSLRSSFNDYNNGGSKMSTIRKSIKKRMRWSKEGTISSTEHLLFQFGAKRQ